MTGIQRVFDSEYPIVRFWRTENGKLVEIPAPVGLTINLVPAEDDQELA